MTELNNFKPGEAWLILPIDVGLHRTTTKEGVVYLLIDITSHFIFGNLTAVADRPNYDEFNDLMRDAYKTKNTWPKKLFVSQKDPATDFFRLYAENRKIPFEPTSLTMFGSLIDTIKKAFKQFETV